MTTQEVRDRVANKALAKLLKLDEDLKKIEDKRLPYISDEQYDIMTESTLREIEVWKFILNSAS